MSLDKYFHPKMSMSTRSNKLHTGQMKTAALTFEATQDVIAKRMGKVQKERQLHKQEIVDAIQKGESKVDQCLLALKAKMDKIEQNMK